MSDYREIWESMSDSLKPDRFYITSEVCHIIGYPLVFKSLKIVPMNDEYYAKVTEFELITSSGYIHPDQIKYLQEKGIGVQEISHEISEEDVKYFKIRWGNGVKLLDKNLKH